MYLKYIFSVPCSIMDTKDNPPRTRSNSKYLIVGGGMTADFAVPYQVSFVVISTPSRHLKGRSN